MKTEETNVVSDDLEVKRIMDFTALANHYREELRIVERLVRDRYDIYRSFTPHYPPEWSKINAWEIETSITHYSKGEDGEIVFAEQAMPTIHFTAFIDSEFDSFFVPLSIFLGERDAISSYHQEQSDLATESRYRQIERERILFEGTQQKQRYQTYLSLKAIFEADPPPTTDD